MIRLRDEALKLLEGDSLILSTARKITDILRDAEIDGAIIGGVAVVLHGYVRTTMDVDVFVGEPLSEIAEAIKNAGAAYSRARREFRLNDVPIHLVTAEQTHITPAKVVEIDGVQTVSLPDLINMKLSSGIRDLLRAIDLADVIGLIRANKLTPSYASKLAKPVRPEFRKLAKAIEKSR